LLLEAIALAEYGYHYQILDGLRVPAMWERCNF
jgi:hypothetical protein